MIIESGFKIFVILRRYLELEPSEKGDDETRNPLSYIKIFKIWIIFNWKANENLNLLKKEFETLFGEDNMLNRLGEFGIDILKTGFSAVESKDKYL